MREHRYFVYLICSSSRRALYTGVTRHLITRVHQHQTSTGSHFSATYKTDRLVHYERFVYINSAIAREKEIKGWRREKKNALINTHNPTWRDLMQDFEPK